jgi:hypothetical protein
MRVTFNNLEIRLQCGVVERVGKLAQTAADVWNDTAFAQFATFDESAPARRSADLLPKTENAACGNFQSVNAANCQTKIMDFSRHQKFFFRFVFSSERRFGFGDDGKIFQINSELKRFSALRLS